MGDTTHPSDPELVTRSGAAKILGCSRSTVVALEDAGRLEATEIDTKGTHWYRVADCDRLRDERAKEPQSTPQPPRRPRRTPEIADTESAGAQMLAIATRHVERLVDALLSNTATVTSALVEQSGRLTAQLGVLEAGRSELRKEREELVEAINDKSAQTEIEAAKIAQRAALARDLGALAPALVSVATGKRVPGRSAAELAIANVLRSLTDGQQAALAKILSPMQLVALMQLVQSADDSDEKKPPPNGASS